MSIPISRSNVNPWRVAERRRGHRLTGDPYDGEYRFYGYGNSRINGVTGSIGLQIGGGL